MSIVGRVARLFKADVHSILDIIEDPQAMLAQAMRDMEEGIRVDESRLADIATQKERAQLREATLRKAVADVGKKIELCIRSKNDTLAREIIRGRLEQEREISSLSKFLDDLTRESERLSAALKRRREKLREIREKAALFRAAPGATTPCAAERCAVPESEVEIAFLAERERIAAQGATDTNGGAV